MTIIHKMRALLILAILAGCKAAREEGPQESKGLHTLLRFYAPRVELGRSVGAVIEAAPTYVFREYVGYSDTISPSRDEFTRAVLELDTPPSKLPPSSTERVRAIRLFSLSTDAARRVEERVQKALDTEPREGCSGGEGERDRIRYWVTNAGRGGVAVAHPLSRPEGSEEVTQLVIFFGAWSGHHLFREYRDEPCP